MKQFSSINSFLISLLCNLAFGAFAADYASTIQHEYCAPSEVVIYKWQSQLSEASHAHVKPDKLMTIECLDSPSEAIAPCESNLENFTDLQRMLEEQWRISENLARYTHHMLKTTLRREAKTMIYQIASQLDNPNN